MCPLIFLRKRNANTKKRENEDEKSSLSPFCFNMKKYIYEIKPGLAPERILKLVGSNKNILEVGCASGIQSRALKEKLGCTITGVEINADAAEEARKYCDEIIIGDIEKLVCDENFLKRKFDVVMFADVLEHLYDPELVLKKIKPVLSDNGYIVASIPNIVHASVIFEMMRGKFDYREEDLLDDTHIRFFTKKTIFQMFENAGFFISSLDRVIKAPQDTEFHTVLVDDEEKSILEYIQRNNQEYETYHFIIKACVSRGGQFQQSSVAEEVISPRMAKVKTLEARVRKAESELQWITNKPIYKIYTKLAKIFKPGSK